MKDNGVPHNILDGHVKEYGVKGLSEFCRLPYWDASTSHLLDYMHIAKNNGHRIMEANMGEDFNEKTKKAMQELSIMPSLTRRENPQQPAWCHPNADIRKEAAKWMNKMPLPRTWCNDHTMAYKSANLPLISSWYEHDT